MADQNSAPTTAQDLPPLPPRPQTHPQPSPAPPMSKKRTFDMTRLENSPYYKIRAIVRDVRPHVIEVLRTPDFQSSKAATAIRQQMKLLLDLLKDVPNGATPVEKFKHFPAGSVDVQDGQQAPKTAEQQHPLNRVPAKASEEKSVFSGNGQRSDEPPSGHIVGGSAFGWNFVTVPGTSSVYYGRTKESFRSSNIKLQE